jgi:hypothetical protein
MVTCACPGRNDSSRIRTSDKSPTAGGPGKIFNALHELQTSVPHPTAPFAVGWEPPNSASHPPRFSVYAQSPTHSPTPDYSSNVGQRPRIQPLRIHNRQQPALRPRQSASFSIASCRKLPEASAHYPCGKRMPTRRSSICRGSARSNMSDFRPVCTTPENRTPPPPGVREIPAVRL